MTAFDINSTSDEVVEALAGNIKGKNIIITGVTLGGLGGEAARVIAKHANLVVLAGRSAERLAPITAAIKAETPLANLRPLVVDLSSLDSVRKAAAEVNEYSENIHVLLNNAGIMGVPFAKTVDGFESHIGTNHFGPFLFTALVFNKLVAAGTPEDPARVVNVSSWGHRFSPIRFDDIHFADGKEYDKWQAYGQSKTANILFANEIARRAKEAKVPVVAYSLHPGGITTTGLDKHIPLDEWKAMGVMNDKGEWTVPTKTVQVGAATEIVASFDPSLLATPGAYLNDADVDESARVEHAVLQENGEKLWKLSEAAVKHDFTI